MKIYNKYSGSSGNMTIVDGKLSTVLIDCGGSTNMFLKALKAEGKNPNDISAVFVTHEHTDHIASLENLLCCNRNTKVFVHKNGYQALCYKIPLYASRITPFDEAFQVDDFRVDFYLCSHDSAFCCGYKLTQEDGTAVASVTDTGFVAMDKIENFFNGCHTVFLESNHDKQMVLSGNYPYNLKLRILSDKGHLSNQQAGEVICRLPNLNIKNIFLSHLSAENNSEEIAFKEAVDNLSKVGAKEGKDINLFIARQYYGGKSVDTEK